MHWTTENAIKHVSNLAHRETWTSQADILGSGVVEKVLGIIASVNDRIDARDREDYEMRISSTWYRIIHKRQISFEEKDKLLECLRDPTLVRFVETKIAPHLRIRKRKENRAFLESYLKDQTSGKYTVTPVIRDMIQIVENYQYAVEVINDRVFLGGIGMADEIQLFA